MESPESSSEVGKRTWTLADRIDFEFLLDEEENLRKCHPEEFDTRMRLDAGALRGLREAPRNVRLRAWLERRRLREFAGGISPGQLIAESRRWVGLVLLFIGAALGLSVVGIAFGSLGAVQVDRPAINAPAFLVIALLPLVVSLVVGVYFFLSLFVRLLPTGGGFVSGVIGTLFGWIARRAAGHVPQEVSRAVGSAVTALRREKALFQWVVISLSQRTPLAYGLFLILGAVVAMLFWKQEFFWGSTFFGDSPASLDQFVRAVAVPWGWFLGEGVGYPSLEAIRASAEQNLRDSGGVAFTSTGWPGFVLAALVVYGLLPRLIFSVVVGISAHSAIARPRFSALRYERFDERLLRTSPKWDPSASEAVREVREPHDIRILEAVPDAADFVLAPKDLEQDAERFGGESLPFPVASGSDFPSGKILVLQEAFMPPTREIAQQIGQLLRKCDRDASVVIGLLGKPGKGGARAGVGREDLEVWATVLGRVGDSRLAVVSVGSNRERTS